MTNISITKAITMTVEDFQKLELSELAELHKMLADSKQKKALKKADLVAGVIQGKKKQRVAEQETKQEELVLVENSVKAPVKPKVKTGAQKLAEDMKANGIKLVQKPKAKTKHDTVKELKELGDNQEQEQEQQGQPEPEKKVEPEQKQEPSFKRPTTETVDLTKLTQEQLLMYIAQLEQKTEKFPSVIDGQKTKYTRTDFESVKAIQDVLLKNPMNLYVFADERLDEKKTQFLVLFASSEVLVLLDRNRQKNTTITLEMKNVSATKLKFPKDKQEFEYAFYIREKK